MKKLGFTQLSELLLGQQLSAENSYQLKRILTPKKHIGGSMPCSPSGDVCSPAER